ncbi:MAG: ComF family protein [Patescibacteria group bacterium]
MNILDLFYPKKCLECNKNGQYICEKCVKKVRPSYFSCPYCNTSSYEGKTHPNCKKKQGLDQLISLWKYDGIVRKAILVLKYRFVFDISEELSNRIYERIIEKEIPLGKNIILTSVPLHKKRQFFRGFNQTEEIAKRLSDYLNWKYLPDILVRNKNTKFQTNLTKKEREKNIKNAFKFNNKYKLKDKNKEVIIFDDVWTTGSTIKEMTKVLKKKGIKTVIALTITKR